jgi:hypothetical protein
MVGWVLQISMDTARAEYSSRLLDLLIKKGIVTKEEAEALKKEAAEEERQKPTGAAMEKPGGDITSQSPEWTRKVEVGYRNGAYIKSVDDRFLLKMNVGVQPLFSYQEREDQEDVSTFRIRRARYYASGHAVYPWLEYSTQLTLEGGSAALRDAYLEATYLDYLRPRVGQYKVPFDREFLKSGFALQFIERSIASSQFSLQRDVGFQLSGALAEKRLSYAAGIFNGSGGNQNNVNTEYMYVGRVVWSPFGPYPYAQPPLVEKDPLLALGLAAAYLPDLEPGERRTLAGVLGNRNIVPVTSNVSQYTADLAFKYKRFSTETGVFFREIDPEVPTAAFLSTDAWGMYAQAGYFLVPEKLEFAARYSYADPDNPTGTGTGHQQEGTLGLNYYIYGHRIKAQLNYSYFVTEDQPEDRDDHTIQTTMVFLF